MNSQNLAFLYLITAHYHGTIFQFIRDILLPRLAEIEVPVKQNYLEEHPLAKEDGKLHAIMPCSLAVNDLKCNEFYAMVYKSHKYYSDFERSPFVLQLNDSSVEGRSVPISKGDRIDWLHVGDQLRVRLIGSRTFGGRVLDVCEIATTKLKDAEDFQETYRFIFVHFPVQVTSYRFDTGRSRRVNQRYF